MKIAKYELKIVHRKELFLTMEDDVDSQELLKIFLETQLKEEKEQSELLGIIAEKVSDKRCTTKTRKRLQRSALHQVKSGNYKERKKHEKDYVWS